MKLKPLKLKLLKLKLTKPQINVIGASVIFCLGLFSDSRGIFKSIWYDEAATYQFSRLPWHGYFSAIRHMDGFYIFYYAIIKLWTAAFGYGEIMLRMPSLLFALAALPLAWALTSKLFGRTAAWLTAALLSTNVYLAFYATQARPYTLMVFATLLSSLVLVTKMTGPPNHNARGAYFATVALSLYANLFSILILPAHLAYMLASKEYKRARTVGLIQIAACVTALPIIYLVLKSDAGALHHSWLQKFTLREIPRLLGTFTGSHILSVCIAALAVYGGYAYWKREQGEYRSRMALILAWVLVPLAAMYALSTLSSVYAARYFIDILTPLYVLAALGISALGKYKYAIASVLVVLSLSCLHQLKQETDDWRDVAREISQTRGDLIVYHRGGVIALDYYDHAKLAQVIYPRDKGVLSTAQPENSPAEVLDHIHAHTPVTVLYNGIKMDGSDANAGFITDMDRLLEKTYTRREHSLIGGILVEKWSQKVQGDRISARDL